MVPKDRRCRIRQQRTKESFLTSAGGQLLHDRDFQKSLGMERGTQRFFRSFSGTASSPMVSYFRFTAFTPAKCSREYNGVEAWPAERMNRHDSVRSDLQGQIAETLATACIQPVPWPWEFLDDRSSPAGRHPCRESGLYLSRGSGCPAYSQGQTSSRRQQMKFGTTFGRFDRNP